MLVTRTINNFIDQSLQQNMNISPFRVLSCNCDTLPRSLVLLPAWTITVIFIAVCLRRKSNFLCSPQSVRDEEKALQSLRWDSRFSDLVLVVSSNRRMCLLLLLLLLLDKYLPVSNKLRNLSDISFRHTACSCCSCLRVGGYDVFAEAWGWVSQVPWIPDC